MGLPLSMSIRSLEPSGRAEKMAAATLFVFPRDALCLQPFHHRVHGFLKGLIRASFYLLVGPYLPQELLQHIDHGQREGNLQGGEKIHLKSGQEILLGRNSDFLTEIEKLNMNVIYRLTDGAYSFTGNTTAFVEVEDGVNEYGLAAGLTSVYPIQRKPGFNAGLLLRYLLEKCKNVLEAISCLHQLPIASAQTLTLADISGEIALVECTPDCVEVTTSLSNTHSFVCDTNAFHLTKMMQYNSVGIDDWFAETRFQTMISAFQNTKKIDLVFVKKLLSADCSLCRLHFCLALGVIAFFPFLLLAVCLAA